MVKAYLHRYEPALSFGVVASPDSNVVHDPSGRLLLAAALDRFAAWDLKRGLPSATFTPSASSSLALAVSCLASSPAAASIASGHADGSIRLWDAETGACEATLHGHRSAASALRFAPSGAVLASGSKDCDVILWDVVAQAGLFRLRGHRDQVTDLLFLDSGKKLVTCSKDKFMRVWDLDTQHCLQIVGGHHSEIWSMDVDPAEKFLVSGSADPELRVFRIRQSADEGEDWNKWDALKLFGEIPRQTIERVQTIRFSKDGSLVACQVAGKTADIYRILDEAEAKTRLHSKKEKATVIDPLSAQDSQNPTLVVTDVFKLLQVLRTSNKICSLAFSPSNPPKGCLATLSLSLNNNVLQTYSVDNDKVSKMYSVEIHGHRSAIRSLSLNSEDNLLMSTSHNAVKIWNPSTGNCLRTIDSGYGLCSAFVPGNRYGLVGTKTGTLEIIDINSGNSVDVIEAHSGSIQSIVLIPDEDGTVNARGFVTGSADHDVKFWEYQLVQKSYSDTKHLSVTNVRTLKMNDDVLAVSIGPTGKHIAVALLDCTVKVFFLDTLKCCLSLYGHELPVLCMDISSDGAFIVTGSAEKNLKIWGMDFGDCHKSIFAHTDSVMDVKFVPRTHYMFSVGKDRTVKYWDADKFELLLTLEGHHAEVWCLAVSSRGDFIVTGSHDRSIRRWDRTEEQLFIEEEREKRLEESFEADLDNAVEDRYGQKDDAPEEGSVGFPGKKTKETITAADAIIDALDTAEEEEKRRNEQKAQPAPPIAPVAPATSFARTPTQAPVSTAETAPPTAQPQAALPATVAASSRNNRINWDEDATTLFAQICSEEIIQSNIVGKPSKDGQERIRLRLLEEGNVNCSIPQVSNKWDAMKKLYNFYNKVKELPVEMQKKHFKTYANKTEYQKLKDGPPEDIKLMEIMFGNKEELPEKPNLTDEKAVMPASFGEVMKLAEVNKESSEKLSKKLEGVIEKLKDLRMLSKSIEQEVFALQMEFRNDMCNIGSVLRRLVYAAEKYYEVVAENQRFINELQELEGGAELLAMKKPAGRSVAGRTTAGRSVAGRTSFQAGRSAGRSVAGGGEATAKRMQKTTSRIGRLPPMKSANCKPKPPKTPDPGGPKSLGGRLFRREEEVEAGEQRETRRRVLSCLSQILEVPSLSEEGSSVVKRNSLKQKQENNAKLAGGCCQ